LVGKANVVARINGAAQANKQLMRRWGKLVQFVSDGDNDLERYRAEYLPHAQQTLDVIHVKELVAHFLTEVRKLLTAMPSSLPVKSDCFRSVRRGHRSAS
jgi:hypothetical protein